MADESDRWAPLGKAEWAEQLTGAVKVAARDLEELAEQLLQAGDEPAARLVRDCAELLAATAWSRQAGAPLPMSAGELLAAERAAREEAQHAERLTRGANRELRRLLALERVRAAREASPADTYPHTCPKTGRRYRVDGAVYHWEPEQSEG